MGHFEYAPDEFPGDEELEAARRVCLDYIEAWYEGDAETMQRVLHPDLAKHTLVRVTSSSGDIEFGLRPHTAQAMVHLVRFPDGWKIVHALWTIENGQIFDTLAEK